MYFVSCIFDLVFYCFVYFLCCVLLLNVFFVLYLVSCIVVFYVLCIFVLYFIVFYCFMFGFLSVHCIFFLTDYLSRGVFHFIVFYSWVCLLCCISWYCAGVFCLLDSISLLHGLFWLWWLVSLYIRADLFLALFLCILWLSYFHCILLYVMTLLLHLTL